MFNVTFLAMLNDLDEVKFGKQIRVVKDIVENRPLLDREEEELMRELVKFLEKINNYCKEELWGHEE